MIKKINKEYLAKYKVIFWDFDGVIKDSVYIKAQAFEKLFSKYGSNIKKKVVNHHNANGGVSRYKKIPLYYKKFVGQEISPDQVSFYANEFSKLVINEVIESSWIPGVKNYLFNNTYIQKFIIVTGTPTEEINIIIEKLGIKNLFISIHGSPEEKSDAVSRVIKKFNFIKSNSVLIGDSNTDHEAAMSNNIDFIFRGKSSDKNVNFSYSKFIENFV